MIPLPETIGGAPFMRKLFAVLLLLMLCISCAPAETEGDFAYSISGGKAAVTAYTGSAAVLTVPDTLGGYPVASIRYCAFRNCETLTHVTLPRGITSIGSNAFSRCPALERIDLPDTLAMIDTHAFYGCPKLAQLIIPDSIERVHALAFYGCSAVRQCSLDGHAARVLTDFGYSFTCPEYPLLSLKAFEDESGRRTFTVADCDVSVSQVAFPEGVTAIDRYAFFDCAALTEIVIPDGVAEIPDSAFEGCTSLRKVALPSSVQTIADSAFARCGDITVIAPVGSAGQEFAEKQAENGLTWRAP